MRTLEGKMPKRDQESGETFAWGVVWGILFLVIVIMAAAYFAWYKPAEARYRTGGTRSAASAAVRI